MTTYYKPVATPIDYPALHEVCGGRLPDTFEAWRAAEIVVRRDLVARGHHVIGLCIVPTDLERFCRTNRCRADGAAMAALVAWRGAEIFGTQADYEAYHANLVVTEDVRAAHPEIVEEEPGAVRKRPWWALWRPKYRLVDAGAARYEAVTAVPRRRRRRWAFWRRRETPAVPAE